MKRFLLALAAAASLGAETGHEAWLRYAPVEAGPAGQRYARLPAVVVAFGDSAVLGSARGELTRGARGMLGKTLRAESRLPKEGAIILGTLAAIRREAPSIPLAAELRDDGYWIKTVTAGGLRRLVITAPNDRGVLYGVFALLRMIGLGEPVSVLDHQREPYPPVRWVNQWDNLDGTIERGYGGPSIFYENNDVRENLDDARDYARLLASLGINGCTVNNVNANTRVISTEFLPQLARIAAVFRPWGVKLSVAIDFSSPQRMGGLDTFDPLDARVAEWWRNKTGEIYRAIPDLGGFVLKAAWDNFIKLDGQFEDNAVLQIKHGPIDFQVREPASPLFGALEKTNQAVELQITQEYFGQARHLCFLVPMWKEALDFDLHAAGAGTPVKALVSGKTFRRPTGGLVGVSNVGRDRNWLGHHLSQANLYGFGRLAWDPDLSAKEIALEWTCLTFGHDQRVVDTIAAMQLRSWRTYENYTGPLGAQTLTDITGNHYGPAVEASERNGWGQWHRADEKGIGMDRTVSTGTGFIGQYRPPVANKARRRPRSTCGSGSRSRGGLTSRATWRCWRAWTTRRGTPRSGAMRSRAGSSAPPASPTRKAAWDIIPAASRPRP